ncbi:MAG: hypothetical protein JO021_00360 [Alphaproteobacteria bacterium]|nr:hypothetical protein [Alphaproteobacteria bacterium]
MTTAILEARLAAVPGAVAPAGAASDLVRLLALDRLPAARPTLVCRWHRDADGRLACSWEPDLGASRR